MEKIRVLHIMGAPMKYGGTEAFIMNYYRCMNHENIVFDFIYQGNEDGVYDNELLETGSRIFHVPYKMQSPFKFSKDVFEILKKHDYKIVHSEMDAMGAWPLGIAKMLNVPVRIAHSHNTSAQTNNKFKLILNEIAKIILKRVANEYYACGKEAGIFLYGKKFMEENKVKVINNAIDLEKFSFSQKKRDIIRSEFNIGNAFVIGHVGQFRQQKNHNKLLEIFNSYLQMNPNSVLFLVGSGDLEDSMREKAIKLNIIDKVIFSGARSDIHVILNAFDIFLFPSLYEGLAIAGLEAQANGLPLIMSDTITKEIIMSNYVESISLDSDISRWVNAINKFKNVGRINNLECIRENGYDITIEAHKLEQRYLYLFRNYTQKRMDNNIC